MEHRISALSFHKKKKCWWLWTWFLAIGVTKGLLYLDLDEKVIKGPLYFEIGAVEMSIKGLLLLRSGIEMSIKGLLLLWSRIEMSIKGLPLLRYGIEMSIKGLPLLLFGIKMSIKGLLLLRSGIEMSIKGLLLLWSRIVACKKSKFGVRL